jgi:predicted transcriptional regulator
MSVVLTVRLNDDEATALDRLVQVTGKSLSSLVREALRFAVKRETEELRKAIVSRFQT